MEEPPAGYSCKGMGKTPGRRRGVVQFVVERERVRTRERGSKTSTVNIPHQSHCESHCDRGIEGGPNDLGALIRCGADLLLGKVDIPTYFVH